MLTENDVREFTDQLLETPVLQIYADYEGFRDFLFDEIYEMYQTGITVQNVIEMLYNNVQLQYLFLMSLGIQKQDVSIFTNAIFGKISKFFTEKGDMVALVGLRDFLSYIGYECHLFTVDYSMDLNDYILTDIVDKSEYTEQYFKDKYEVDFDHQFVTPGHIVDKEYYYEHFKCRGTTVVVYILMDFNVYLDSDKNTLPTSLLEAYAFTKYHDDNIRVIVNSHISDLDIHKFFAFTRIIYLKWLQLRNEGFDVGGSPGDFWYLIKDEDQLGPMHDALDFLFFEADTPSDLEYYLRTANRILGKADTRKGEEGHNIEYILNTLNEYDPDLVEIIKNSSTSDLENIIFSFNLSISIWINNKLNETDDEVDKIAIKTLKYIFSIVYRSMYANIRRVKNMEFAFKKYFLPVYTEFRNEIIRPQKIKNWLNKVYLDSMFDLTIMHNQLDLLRTRDKNFTEMLTQSKDAIKIFETQNLDIDIDIKDREEIVDKIIYNCNSYNINYIHTSDKSDSLIKNNLRDKLLNTDYNDNVTSAYSGDDEQIEDNFDPETSTNSIWQANLNDKDDSNTSGNASDSITTTDYVSYEIY